MKTNNYQIISKEEEEAFQIKLANSNSESEHVKRDIAYFIRRVREKKQLQNDFVIDNQQIEPCSDDELD